MLLSMVGSQLNTKSGDEWCHLPIKFYDLRCCVRVEASGPASPVLAGSLSAIAKDRNTLIEQSVGYSK